ncbi:MAG TPA: beta-eliminating lyase-related protein [Rectinemataceae bacterium]|nr:beta-eliminating lyase-related protein [Rectinemataceae bacterium]
MAELMLRSFASDNNSGAAPEIIEAIAEANMGHAVGYGDDPWTSRAEERFAAVFGPQAHTYFVLNGTGSNVLALSLVASHGQAVLCAEGAHIAVDETGAPEAAVGCKVIQLESSAGKIQAHSLRESLSVLGSVHQAQPSCLSLSQPTELGTLYSPEEMRELISIAHDAGLRVHMDGARIANAAAGLGLGLADVSSRLGVDVLSFGGMKNGVAFGEALVVLDPGLAQRAPFLRKTHLQLDSKMRFISAQYDAYLSKGVWLRNATAANAAAQRLKQRLSSIPDVELVYPVQSNALFARIPRAAAERLRSRYFFYDWEGGLVRWMTSFDTTAEDVERFADALGSALQGG